MEGFYGSPWAHEDRLWMLEWLADHGHNSYIYAPVNDPKHRDFWRQTYDPAELGRFAELVETAKGSALTLGYGIRPGPDIIYSDPAEFDVLRQKLEPLLEIGVGMVFLLFDDIPVEQRGGDPVFGDDYTAGQAHLGNCLLEWLGDLPYFVCPPDYIGRRASPTLVRLGKALDPGIPIAWTGPQVTSPIITAADAAAVAADVGRPLVLCDNYPVNDGVMRLDLKLGPYPPRDPALAEHCVGLFLNPMIQCRASAIAVATAGRWCAEPSAYDPEAELDRVVGVLAGPAAAALSAVVDACRWSQVDRRPAPRFSRLAQDLLAAWPSQEWWSAAAVLTEVVATSVQATAVLAQELPDRRLWKEIEPWCAQQEVGARVLEAALASLLAGRPDVEASWVGDQLVGRIRIPWDRGMLRRLAYMLELWQDSYATHMKAYGARVGLAPLTTFGEHGQIVGPDVAFNENAVDRFVLSIVAACRQLQESWPGGPEAVALSVDGISVPVTDGGTFSSPAADGSILCVGWGSWGTRRRVHLNEPVQPLDGRLAPSGNALAPAPSAEAMG